jgi:hypothetical protein
MDKGGVPALLYYHINYENSNSVTPEAFEEQLKYLKQEGYATISKEQLGEFMKSGKRNFEKAVLITLDGGYLDTWVYAYPLLKKYGFSAISFVISWNVEEDEYLGFNLDDYYSGKITKDMLPNCNSNIIEEGGIKRKLERRLCWREVREMEKSGIIDIQPSSKFHRKVYASDKIIGFNSPLSLSNQDAMLRGDERLGTPDFERQPEFITKEFIVYQDLRDKLAQFVKDNGYLSFFKKPNWENELYDIVDDYKKEKSIGTIGEWETDEQLNKRIYSDLEVSKGEIGWETKKICKAFAWPWGAYNERSLEIAKKVGFEYIFTTKEGTNSYGDSTYEIKRIKIDDSNMDTFKHKIIKYSK